MKSPANRGSPERPCAAARLALRLERDLELNLAGVALAFELIEELQQLRREHTPRRQMTRLESDAFVFFGATGDLAYKRFSRRYYAMVRRDGLNIPIIGMARAGGT